MKFQMLVKNDRAEWWEDYDERDVFDLVSAKKAARMMIENYNKTLFPGDLPRAILEIKMGGEGLGKHDWEKTNLVTVMGRDGMNWDTLRCRSCGCEARRYGLANIVRIGRWKSSKWKICNPKQEAK